MTSLAAVIADTLSGGGTTKIGAYRGSLSDAATDAAVIVDAILAAGYNVVPLVHVTTPLVIDAVRLLDDDVVAVRFSDARGFTFDRDIAAELGAKLVDATSEPWWRCACGSTLRLNRTAESRVAISVGCERCGSEAVVLPDGKIDLGVLPTDGA